MRTNRAGLGFTKGFGRRYLTRSQPHSRLGGGKHLTFVWGENAPILGTKRWGLRVGCTYVGFCRVQSLSKCGVHPVTHGADHRIPLDLST